MIKRYIQFLNENIENQSVLMNETEIIEFLNSRLKFSSGRIFKDILFDDINYNHNDKLLTPILYRGIKSKEEYFKTDYTNYNRFAHNSARSRTITSKNLLNLILSNDKRFSEFQKRNKSIIGSNYKDVSSDFGNIYFLFPIEENPKFTYIKDNFDLYNITENPIDIQPAIEKILKMYNIDLNDTDYTEYLEITKEFDNKCTNPVFLEKFFNIIKNIPIRNFIRQRLWLKPPQFLDRRGYRCRRLFHEQSSSQPRLQFRARAPLSSFLLGERLMYRLFLRIEKSRLPLFVWR
jgi:hypothetical protein